MLSNRANDQGGPQSRRDVPVMAPAPTPRSRRIAIPVQSWWSEWSAPEQNASLSIRVPAPELPMTPNREEEIVGEIR